MITYADEQLQRTNDWYKARLGNVTGSRCADLMVKGRGKDEVFGKTALTYLYLLAFERGISQYVLEDESLFQQYIDHISTSSKAIRWGQEHEGEAIRIFEDITGLVVQEVASCKHDMIPHFAASPDGMIFQDKHPVACVEVKCPEPTNFMMYSANIHDAESLKATNPTYYWQVTAEMCCTAVDKCYFIVYNPFHQRPLHIAEIHLDNDDALLLEQRIHLANDIIDNTINNGRLERNPLP